MGKYDVIFTPMKIGSLEVKNRVVLCPMGIHSHRLVNPDGSFTDDAIRYYERIAEGGTGLIVTSAMSVQTTFDCAKGSKAGMNNAGTEYIVQSRKLTDRIHKTGAKIFLQLSSGTGRVSFAPLMEGESIAASDDMPNVWNPEHKHRGLTKDEIQMYIDSFASGAKKAQEAGFDGVEIHAVHEGYLLDQFTIAFFNHRTDEYGGDLEGRLAFPRKVVEAIKNACGKDFPVALRYSVRSMIKGFNDGAIPGEDFVEAGRDLEEGIKAAKLLESYGYDMLDADNGTYDSWWWPHPPVYMPEGCNLSDCEAVQKEVSIPVVCAGRMENPSLALEAIKKGRVTGIGLARQLLADPDWVKKLENDNAEDIRPCIACHAGCLNRIFKGQDLCCALNPAVAREDSYELKEADVKKKVMIIGGGIGGMEAARVSAIRGHKVDLYEKTDKLGGVFIPASAMSFKASDKRLLEWYKLQLKKLKVNVHMNTEVTEEVIESENPNVIFQATGSTVRKLNILGADKPHVFDAVTALNYPEKVFGDVVIIGGGLTGVELAYEYAKKGFKVTILEAQDKILNVDVSAANKNYLLAAIKVYGIEVVTNVALRAIEDKEVVYSVREEEKRTNADTVIVSIGYNSYKPFEVSNKEVYTIGDADKVSNLMGAIWTAYETAMNV